MPNKFLRREFLRIDEELDVEKPHGSLQDDILDVLSRAFGWYDAGKRWKKINVDNQGRLLVSQNAGQTSEGNQTVAAVTNVATRFLVSNLNRRSYLVQNTGGATIYLGLNASLTVANGMILAPGAAYDDSIYVGEIWLIANVVSTEARILEF